jgi:ribosome-associated protein
MLQITPRLAIHEGEVQESFVRSSGPGGQNVNKVSTAVELRFDIRRSSLPRDMQARLIRIAGNRVTADGVLLVDARATRSQKQNREDARERLVELLRLAALTPKKRRATKPSKTAKETRIKVKKIRSTVKRQRAHPRSADDD